MLKNKDNHIIEPLFSRDLIEKRVSEVAKQIAADFKGKKVLIIAVLNGSFIFCADLIRKLGGSFEVDFISLSSYSNMTSDGKVKLLSNFNQDLKDKNILIVEDIADTGNTLKFLCNLIEESNVKSISRCVLLDKRAARKTEVKIEYSCFNIEDNFVVGYGLDFNGLYRGLPYIGVLKIK